jgi:Domain of unknown function (DUF6265)
MTMTLAMPLTSRASILALALAFAVFAPTAAAQSAGPMPPATGAAPAPAEPPKAAPDAKPAEPAKDAGKDAAADATPSGPLAQFAWLAGCWKGAVNQREFREVWLPARGNLMVGVGHNALPTRTVSYELLKIEPRADGVFYVATPSGQKEVPFKLTNFSRDGPDELFLFTNASNPFPQQILYRRGTGGWLYVEVAGKVKDKNEKVVYPFRRVDCETGEFIRQ